MDLVHLKSFAEVAERGTVAAAATAQGYTAPAVSQHIAKLEAELGKQLFDRLGGRLQITTAGAALLPIALEMVGLEALGRDTVAEPVVEPRVVFAGFASAISTVLLPHLDLVRRHASVEISEAEDAEALRELRLGSVDVVLTQEYEGTPSERDRRFTYTPLVNDQLTLVCPPDMPASTTIGQLADAPWLLNGRTTRCALATQQILAAAGISPRIVGTIADNTTLLTLVAAGHGVTVVPARVLDGALHDVTIASQDLRTRRTIFAVTRTASTPSLLPVLDALGSPTN